MAWGQVNAQRLEETMYVALSQSVRPGGAGVGVFEFTIQRDRGKATNKRSFYGTL